MVQPRLPARDRPTQAPITSFRGALCHLAALAGLGPDPGRALLGAALLLLLVPACAAWIAYATERRRQQSPLWQLADRLSELAPSEQAQIVDVLNQITQTQRALVQEVRR